MLTQTLPRSATEYARANRAEQRAAIAAVRRQLRRMGPDFDASWNLIAPTILAIIATAQQRTAALGADYIPAVLEETGQVRSIPTTEKVNIAAFAGVAGSGLAVADVIDLAPIRAKQAVAAGKTATQALDVAGSWLTRTSGTILSDTGRAAEVTAMGVRPVTGWVRMLTPPSCGRCAVLAGRRYWNNQGFERHPGCDCRHIPASEAVAGDFTLDFEDYLGSLDKASQVKLLGSEANWTAWSEYGANPTQIVNAYRAGLSTAQDRFGNEISYTLVGTSRRGWAGHSMRNRATQLDIDAGLVTRAGKTGLVRRMPETILRTTQSREQIIRQMRIYGWTIRP